MLQLHTFGGLRIEHDGQPLQLPTQKACDLLAYLILHHDRPLSRDLLAGTFWPERADPRARQALSQALWQIRSTLGPAADRLLAERDTITFLFRPDDWLDVADFEEQASANSASDLNEAVALYQADFLEGCYDDWALLERERLRELYLGTLELLIALHKRRGEYKEALANAQRLVAADPLRESIHQELMRLYHLLSRDRAALEQYQTLHRILANEVGAEPMAATVALAQEIAARLEETASPYLPLQARLAPVFDQPECIPLVGREEERATLLTHLEATVGGRGGLVLVEGEAGVGKTRLVQELARDAEWRGVEVRWGRGWELAELPPYGVLREPLQAALSPLRAGQLAELVEGEWLREASLVLPELAEWLPDLPPSLSLGPEQRRARLLEGLTRTVLALGQIAPQLLVLDDLQWADDGTLSALAHLAPRLAESRVLVVASYRGEDAREQPAIREALQALDRASGRLRLLLARLTAEGTGELVRRGLGLAARAPLFEERLYHETEGNPLFVLETLRALQSEGLLYRDENGDWSTPWDEATTDYAELPLPAGVCQVINRRLARLDALERVTLDVAAVLGGDFDFTLLARASRLNVQVALTMVGELLRQRFLVEEPNAYRFSHDKIRQATYVGIEQAERQRLHRQAGQALELLYPERVEQLARHFSLGQVWDRAVDTNRRAGQQAWAVYAVTEALGYYDQALEARTHLQPPDESLGLALYEERGRICQDTGRFDQAEADFQAAFDLAEQAGDQAGQARVLNHLSYLQWQQGDFSATAEIAQRALDLATAAGIPSETATGLFNKANAIRDMGQPQSAIGLYERAIALYEEQGDRKHLADALNRMGAALKYTGAFAEARSVMERALAIRRQLDDKMGIAYSLGNLGFTCYHQGQFALAREALQECLEIAGTIGDTWAQAATLNNIGWVPLEQGLLTEAISFFQRALEIACEIGSPRSQGEVLSGLGRAYHQLGDLERAQELLEQALDMIVTTEQTFVPRIYVYLAEVCLESGRSDEAQAYARAGLRAARETESPWHLGLTHRVMGEVASHAGSDEPEPHFEESIRVLREIGAEAELARSLAAYGLYLTRSPGAEAAQRSAAMLEEARTLFLELGMARDLAQLEAEAPARLPPGQVSVRLPRAGASTGRPLRDDEYVAVTWTVAVPEDEVIPSKVIRRRHCLLRLLREAADQSAAPTVPDLAAALEVTTRTIERDLAALRAAGHDVRTRGSRSSITSEHGTSSRN